MGADMTQERLLEQWHRGICISQVAHKRYAAWCLRNHRIFGIPSILLTTAAGAGLFALPKEGPTNGGALTAAAVVSLLAAAFAGVQTFLNYSELAIKHAEFGKKYGRLRKFVETIMAADPTEEEMGEVLKEVQERWDALEDEAPTLPQAWYDRARTHMSGKQKAIEG